MVGENGGGQHDTLQISSPDSNTSCVDVRMSYIYSYTVAFRSHGRNNKQSQSVGAAFRYIESAARRKLTDLSRRDIPIFM